MVKEKIRILTRFFISLLSSIVLLWSSLIPLPSSLVYSAVPHLINYQGRLTDSSGTPLNGSYSLTFRIYDAETAGNLLWEETHSGVVIQKGIFSVLLGSVKNLDDLPFNKQYYLEIKVGNEVLSPRQIIASAAYAIAGVPPGVIVMWSGSISSIPKGWALCDGANGTPDLRDRFIVGVRQDDAGVAKTNITGSLTQSGGSTTITEANLPSHTHGAGTLAMNNTGAHTHNINNVLTTSQGAGQGTSANAQTWSAISTTSAGDHTHTISGLTAATGSGTSYTQPYYALAYIMKL